MGLIEFIITLNASSIQSGSPPGTSGWDDNELWNDAEEWIDE